MDPFHKSCVTTDLASLHYVTFIESLAIFSTKTLSFDSEQFKNVSINKEIDSKIEDPFLLLDEHFFATDLVYKKVKFNLKGYHMRFSSFFFINVKIVVKYLCIIKFTTTSLS
jgi:hypothetical protein